MSVDDEVMRLTLELEGAKSAEEIAQKLAVIKGLIFETGGAYELVKKDLELYGEAEDKTTDKIVADLKEQWEARRAVHQIQQEMLDEQEALKTSIVTTSNVHSAMHRGMGQAMLQTSYAVQDFTSQFDTRGLAGALAAVQNNIPGILMGLGVTGGIAGAISMVSVALAAMQPMWEKIFGGESAAKLKEVSDLAKKIVDEAKSLAGTKTTTQDEEESDVKKFLKNAPGSKVKDAIDRSVQIEGLGDLVGQRDELKRLEALANDFSGAEGGEFIRQANEMRFNALREKMKAQNQAIADHLLGTLPTDRGARERVSGFASTTNPEDYPRNFATDIMSFEPGDMAATDAGLQKDIASGEAAHNARLRREASAKAQDAKRKAQDASLKRLTDEGVREADADERENEAAMRTAADLHDMGVRAESAAAKAAAEADKKAATANAPMARLAAEQRAREQAMADLAFRQWDAGGRRESPAEVQSIVRDAVGRLPDVGGSFAAALQAAVEAGHRKAANDLDRAMQNMRQMSNSRMGN